MRATLLCCLPLFFSCQNPKAPMDTTDRTKPTNRLAQETSPYLLQHQHNPVDWYPWGEEAFEKARAENKLVLISIGYSSCHWCHVMEHESFEDDSVAALMNRNFVSIKVDREERPDVDQVYMNAVQLMTGRGGWPLNCFALPDGRPVYGGTYFPKEQWVEVLDKLNETWTQQPEVVKGYAEQLTEGVKQSDLITVNEEPPLFVKSLLKETVEVWMPRMDFQEGGPNRSPKFPLPNNYQFLLRYGYLEKDEKLLDQVYLTLDKMAQGGIYDQIGGGFSRYSTDGLWKVPHFEKMLYDNAQLLSLYSEAFQATKKPLYKDVVYETIEWLCNEMMDEIGAFYSALDADSEGEEGKFYVWTEEELKTILKEDFDLAAAYYNVNAKGRWEHGNYILLRSMDDAAFAREQDLELPNWIQSKARVRETLMARRSERVRPGLDDKALTSWNALTITGLVDAGMAFGDDRFIELALNTGNFIWDKQRMDHGALYHSFKGGVSSINGYLEDYSFTAQAFISLYQATLDETWLNRADQLLTFSIEHFRDEQTGMFYFTSDEDPPLITRKFEIDDNVIPSSNSSLARALHTLGTLYERKEWIDMSLTMLNNVKAKIPDYGSGYSNWAILTLHEVYPYYELAVAGPEPERQVKEFSKTFIPNKLFMGDTDDSSAIPLLEYKFVEGETMIYVCVNKSCKLPVSTVAEALGQID